MGLLTVAEPTVRVAEVPWVTVVRRNVFHLVVSRFGFRVWGLKFGVEVLGFRVKGLRFGV